MSNPAANFEPYRRRLLGLAYRMLGSMADAEDAEVAATLERSEAACRQLAFRARAHVRDVRPRGAIVPPARSGEIDAKYAQLLSAFMAATQAGDVNALTQFLASDVRVVSDGGGKVRAALEMIEGADRVARLIVGAMRPHPGQWWREDFTVRLATVNGLPGVIVDAPEGVVQTAAFEIESGLIHALYVVRNPRKLRHLAAGSATWS